MRGRKAVDHRSPGIPTRPAWKAVVGLIALHLVLCAVLFDPKIHTGGDSVTYVLLAESILEVGDGYSLSVEPGPPEAHTLYPPGYPVLLAPLVALFGRNFFVLKVLSVLFTAGTVAVFCYYARRHREPLLWFCLALAFAVNPGVIDYSRWMLSGAAFLFLTLCAVWQLDEDARDPKMGWAFALGLLASVGSFYVRSIGALLLVAGSLSYAVRREWHKFVVHGLVGSALTIPWLVRNSLASGASSAYFDFFGYVNVYAPEAGRLDALGFVERLFDNAWIYATREMPRALAGSDSTWAAHPVTGAVALVLCGLALLGLVRALRRGAAAHGIYFVLSLGAVLLFQEIVADVRYLVPIMPLFLVYAADGASAIAARIGRARWVSLLPVHLMAVLVLLALASASVRAPDNAAMIGRYLAGDGYAGYAPAWRHFFEAAAWVEDNTAEDAVVTVRKPRLFHALTGRLVRQYPFSRPDSVLRVVRSTDYVIVDPIHATTDRYLVPAIQRDPDAFLVAYRTEEPRVLVLRVRDVANPSSPEPN